MGAAPGQVSSGDRIGDYRVELVLGRGPHADVCAAAHVRLPRSATIRVARGGQSPAGVRLLREACIVETLNHPGIPRLYDCGRLPDRTAWVASERVDGRALSVMIRTRPMLPLEVARLVRDVAAILEHAHRRGVVHRAVGPDTILVTDDGRGWPVCLSDWSCARTLDAVPAPGQPGPHDAPEHARGTLDHGTIDVFALGVAAFEALSGTPAFRTDAPLTMVADQVTRFLRQRGVVTAATGQLAWLIDDMLAAAPSRRPSSADVCVIAGDLALALEREASAAAELAMAVLAVDEIELDYDTIDIDPMDAIVTEELTIAPAGPIRRTVVIPPLPRDALSRVRKPRWTPPIGQITSDNSTQIAGEIDTERRAVRG
jgi:serine/threonine-protein kinase